MSPRKSFVSYAQFTFNAGVEVKLMPIAVVNENCDITWCHDNVPSSGVHEALAAFMAETMLGHVDAIRGRGRLVVGSGSVLGPAETNDIDQQQPLTLHVVTINVQSIRHRDRCKDFMAELADATFEIIFVNETWRKSIKIFSDACAWLAVLDIKVLELQLHVPS